MTALNIEGCVSFSWAEDEHAVFWFPVQSSRIQALEAVALAARALFEDLDIGDGHKYVMKIGPAETNALQAALAKLDKTGEPQ